MGNWKLKVMIAAILALLCTTIANAEAPTDVPTNHWAYEAVQTMLDRGYLQGFPGGKFLGERPLTRYEFATVVKRLVDDVTAAMNKVPAIGTIGTATTSPVTPTTTGQDPEVTKSDIGALQKLISEFKVELTVISGRLDDTDAKLAELASKTKTIEAIVTDEEGPLEVVRADVKTLKKITVSGYVQARYTHSGNDFNDPTPGKEPFDDFSIRRARLKIVGKPTTNSTSTIQLDFGGNNATAVDSKGSSVTVTPMSVKDAFLTYAFDGSSETGLSMSAGQQKWPFGYEVLESSGSREAPERCIMVARAFPGERDRGFTLSSATAAKMAWMVGAFSGAGANTADYNKDKDLVAKATYNFGDMNIGASAYFGEGFKDATGKALSGMYRKKIRYGVDVQRYMENISIKGEFIFAKGCEKISSKVDPEQRFTGGYGQITYSLVRDYVGVLKYEWISLDPLYPTFGRRSTWQLGAIRYLDAKTRIKLFYQKNDEVKSSFDNDSATLEWITAF